MRCRSSQLLVAILLLSVVLRVAVAIYLGDQVEILPGTYDQISYDTLAQRLVAGHGFTFATEWWPVTRAGEPTAHWSFLYTLYLTAVYWLFSPHPLAARLIQAVLAGILMPLLTYRIGRRVFEERVGLVAAGLTAIYAYFVYYNAALMTESFCIITILWTLDVALRIGKSANQRMGIRANREWIELGVALGMAALLRQVILLLMPFLFAWLWWAVRKSQVTGRRSQVARLADRQAIRNSQFAICLLTTVAVIAILILPWTVRNYRAFGRFVLLNTNAGYALFWANHPIYGTQFKSILPSEMGSYQALIPPELRHLDEAALDQALLKRGLQFVVDDPGRYVLLSLSRIKSYFKFWPSAESPFISNVSRVLSFGLFLPFMAYGLVLSIVRGPLSKQSSGLRTSDLGLLYLFIVVYTLIHLLSWALIRYRLPVDAILIVFAAVAIVDLTARLTGEKGLQSAAEG
jgi:hypothetical protein